MSGPLDAWPDLMKAWADAEGAAWVEFQAVHDRLAFAVSIEDWAALVQLIGEVSAAQSAYALAVSQASTRLANDMNRQP